MYRGMFRRNGNCGYVLKPAYLIDKTHVSPQSQKSLEKYIKLRIISGQNLPKVGDTESSVVDPYVTVKVQGHPDDSFNGRTRFIPNNGFNPYWNENLELFLKAAEQAVICFTVKDKQSIGSSRFIGSYTLPVVSLTPGYFSFYSFSCSGLVITYVFFFFSYFEILGYRHVPLMSSSGDSLVPASICIHVEMKNLNN